MISVPVTETSQENVVALDQIFYIHYSIKFNKNKAQALINSSNKINAMTLKSVLKPALKICTTNVKIMKIDISTLEMFRIVLASF